jgi:hypothetical protein
MCCSPNDLNAAVEGLMVGFCAFEGGKERMVDVLIVVSGHFP